MSIGKGLTTAEHEAAHAVVAHRLGFPVGFATIVPADGVGGFVVLKPHEQLTPADRIASPRQDPKGVPLDDLRSAARLLVAATSSLQMAWRPLLGQLRTCRDAAIDIIRDRQNWCAIKRLSCELEAHRAMTGPQIQECLDRSDALCAAGDFTWPLSTNSGPTFPFS